MCKNKDIYKPECKHPYDFKLCLKLVNKLFVMKSPLGNHPPLYIMVKLLGNRCNFIFYLPWYENTTEHRKVYNTDSTVKSLGWRSYHMRNTTKFLYFLSQCLTNNQIPSPCCRLIVILEYLKDSTLKSLVFKQNVLSLSNSLYDHFISDSV